MGCLCGGIRGLLDHRAQSGMARQLSDQGFGDGSRARGMGHCAAFRHADGAGARDCLSIAESLLAGAIESSLARRGWALCASSSPASRWPVFLSSGWGYLKILLVGLACSIGSVIFTLGPALIGEISPASQRGAMLGVSNSIHTLAGVCAPFVMGRIVDINANPIGGISDGLPVRRTPRRHAGSGGGPIDQSGL